MNHNTHTTATTTHNTTQHNTKQPNTIHITAITQPNQRYPLLPIHPWLRLTFHGTGRQDTQGQIGMDHTGTGGTGEPVPIQRGGPLLVADKISTGQGPNPLCLVVQS